MTLSPFLGRTLAVVLLLAAIGGIWSLIVEPVMTKYRLSAESMVQSEALIERYLRIAKVRVPLEKQLVSLRRQGASRSGYLEGASDTLAAAKLQNRVKGVVATSGGEIKSSQILPPRDDGNHRAINIRVQLSADIAGLQAIFHALESENTLLFLDNVDVRRQRSRRRKSRSANDGRLTVRFDVSGYVRREGS
ncbi:MAG: type II secretion system protein M [Proteobacteria bacterium]|nr:type II secretion system protein M [Pseudomonadota bacterium]